MVADSIRQAVDKFPLYSCLRHQSGAVCDLIYPLLQLYRLRHMIGTDHVQNAGPGLHYVGAAAAGIGDGIVDPRPAAHMLP